MSLHKKPDPYERLLITLRNVRMLLEPVEQIYLGIRSNTIAWKYCGSWMLLSAVVVLLKVDEFLISKTRFTGLYPYYPFLYHLYVFGFTTAGFWLWGWIQVKKNRDKLRKLTEAFKNASLESRMGRLPNLISDYAIDASTRKLRLTNAGLPLQKFQEQSAYIANELGIFIDEIKEHRERRTIDIIYSHVPMPSSVFYKPELARHSYEFVVGQTRSKTLTANLRDTPHIMIAGQTGGGKSTFLRQFICHLSVKHKQAKFLLIDLKGGLEFSMFEGRRNFSVVPHVMAAVEDLIKINSLLEQRMAFLKANKCKDIDAYWKRNDKIQGSVPLARQIIVVDEAAEMFLAGHHGKANDIQKARGILSRIARQGRAVGVHLVVATQRPDTRSLDPQVKANLTGVICFQMVNDASSIAVLGNGRATDIPKIPGRAIWKNGIDMVEIQTPFLSVEDAEAMLEPVVQESNVKEEQTMRDVTVTISQEDLGASDD